MAITRAPERATTVRTTSGYSGSPTRPFQRPSLDQDLLTLGLGQRPNPPARWPEGRRFALCLTHDVDFVSSKSQGRKLVRRLRRTLLADGPRLVPLVAAGGSLVRLATDVGRQDRIGDYAEWIRMESELGFRSTFYFFPSRVSALHAYDCDYHFRDPAIFDGRRMRIADVARTIAEAGWEIGLHGSYLSAKRLPLLIEQRQDIEEVVQRPVTSIRQHYLQYDISITPIVQAAAGLLCDSTQGFNSSIGFRSGTSFPYWCWDFDRAEQLPLLEIPLSVMDIALFSSAGLGLTERSAIEHCLEIMNVVERVGGCMTLNWHPNYLMNSKYRNVYITLLQEAHHRNAWGCSAAELYDWWTTREKQLSREVATHL